MIHIELQRELKTLQLTFVFAMEIYLFDIVWCNALTYIDNYIFLCIIDLFPHNCSLTKLDTFIQHKNTF